MHILHKAVVYLITTEAITIEKKYKLLVHVSLVDVLGNRNRISALERDIPLTAI